MCIRYTVSIYIYIYMIHWFDSGDCQELTRSMEVPHLAEVDLLFL